jgi:hypothetical protein
MWMVRRLEEGGSSLVVPSSVSDLIALASAVEVSLRPLTARGESHEKSLARGDG